MRILLSPTPDNSGPRPSLPHSQVCPVLVRTRPDSPAEGRRQLGAIAHAQGMIEFCLVYGGPLLGQPPLDLDGFGDRGQGSSRCSQSTQPDRTACRGAPWGANGEQTRALNGLELHSTAPNVSAPTCESCISAGRRNMSSLVHTEEVTGSIPVSPTPCFCWSQALSVIFVGMAFVIFGSSLGARPADHLPRSEEVMPLLSSLEGGEGDGGGDGDEGD